MSQIANDISTLPLAKYSRKVGYFGNDPTGLKVLVQDCVW